MKFIVHDYHNNNSYPVGDFHSPEGYVFIPHDGYITEAGVTFFMLPKVADLEERTAVITSLHALLKDKYSHGISAVTCAVSDCIDQHTFEGLFKNVKALDTAIRTIEVVHPREGDPKSPHADFCVPNMNDRLLIQATILQAVAPTPEDRVKPREGWESYRVTLTNIYARALKSERPPNRPIRHLLDRLRNHW